MEGKAESGGVAPADGESGAASEAQQGAQETTPGQTGQADKGGPRPAPSLFSGPWIWIAGLLWLWFIWSSKKQKKKQAERQQKLDSIQKGDKVVTIGRLHGKVVSANPETVTIKPDDKSGVTLTFDRVAVHEVNPKKKETADAAEGAGA